jgi:hypothetical protein
VKKTPGERLARNRLAYIRTFCGDGSDPHPEGQRVLAELRRFCGITKGGLVVSPVSRTVDPYATIYRAALRDVYLHVTAFLTLDDKTLFQEPDHVEISET